MGKYFELRPAKTETVSVSAQVGMLSSFLSIGKYSLLNMLLLQKRKYLSLEIASIEQKTRFFLHAPPELEGYFISQVLSQYPKTLVVENKVDPLFSVVKGKSTALATFRLAHSYNYPIKTYKAFTELPPLSAILGFLSKLHQGEAAFLQIVLRVVKQERFQQKIRSSMKSSDETGKEKTNPYNKLIQEKLSSPLLAAQIRLVFSGEDKTVLNSRLAEFAGAFGIYTLSEGNSFVYSRTKGIFRKPLFKKMIAREFYLFEPVLYLNLEELASLWHLPDEKFSKIKSINWGRTYISEAPDNLPISSQERDHGINYFARTEYRNREEIFGIRREDRRRHVYVIGKTGAGKSTLIANKAINDIRNGEGVAVIDPHGDLSEMILDYIPKRRINDVVYLDPTLSNSRAFSLNLFDKEGVEHTDVVASGIVSVFYKLYHHSWGPRLEYILRNTILTLLYYGDATFVDIPRLLTNKQFRNRVLEKLKSKDKVLVEFWENEYNKMSERLRTEAISSVLNKIGQFLASERIRHIVANKKSTFSFDEVMNEGKILILNLSQGKLGEDTTALLGAMFITKMQLTAMRRVALPEEKRRDFYLYVDEFQNFATSSFIKILSEARKYRLNLILANQYIGQVEEDIQKAIFGNVGTLITFVIGARDAVLFEKEFGKKYTANDLVSLGKFQILLKMAIDGLTSEPFLAVTLPLPSVKNNNRGKILNLVLERYYKKI